MTEERPARRLTDKIRDALEHARRVGREEIAKRLELLYDSAMSESQEHHPLARRQRDPNPSDGDR